MQLWNDVRQHVLAGGHSAYSATRKFGVHWTTVKKILASSEPIPYKMAQPRKKPMIGEFLPIIEQMLLADRTAPRKQRHTSKRIYDRLKAEHNFQGGYTVVKDAVRDWHQIRQEVFVPLTHKPGEAQMDFGHAVFLLNGVETDAHLCVLTLPYSDVVYIQAYPRECSESFFDGHVRAFEFFGGVPVRTSYDNSRIPVKKIVGAHERELTDGFLRFQSHHLFVSHFCRVRCPNEKGHVETLVQYGRNNFLVPMPSVRSFEELNQLLHDRCVAELTKVCRGETRTKGERLEDDRKAFLSLPKERFEAKRVELTAANKMSLVRFDRNDYSVPTAYAHHEVAAIGTVSEVRLLVKDEVVAVHPRSWEKEQAIYNPVHYFSLLERKPGALDFARPLENYHLPPSFETLRRRLDATFKTKGPREYIRVLRLLENASVPELDAAVTEALDLGFSTADAIRVILEGSKDKPTDVFNLDGHPHLKLVRFDPPDLQAYQFLMPDSPVLRLTGGAQ